VFRGVIAALDGCIFWQKNPGVSVHNAIRYHVARKCKYGILASAICDSQRRFLWFDMSHTPSTHDYSAFADTDLGQRIYNNELPYPFFLLGDNAYVCSKSVIVPGDDDDFNYEQSALRMNIECAFGELIRRWGILWRPLEVNFNRRTDVIAACMRLHNFCVDHRIEMEEAPVDAPRSQRSATGVRRQRRPTVRPIFDRDGRPVDNLESTRWHTFGNVDPTSRSRRHNNFDRREELEKANYEAGLKRPYERQ
jgi:hypothetical protein